MSARAFSLQIDNELNLALDELRTVVARISLDALGRIVERTPVDTGRARGNWFVEFDAAGIEVTDTEDKDGNATIARGSEVISHYRSRDDFPVVSIYNNLPYIGRLEDGYSNQAPTGMVSVTVTELRVSL